MKMTELLPLKKYPSTLMPPTELFYRWLALDCKGGAQTTIYVAVDEAAQQDSGEYFSACGKTFMHPLAKDKKACEELWEESIKECGLC